MTAPGATRIAFALSLVLAACGPAANPSQGTAPPPSPRPAPVDAGSVVPPKSALLAPWAGPHGGVPPFAGVDVATIPAAIAAGMDEERREIAAIVGNPAAPTFENTVAALEDAGRALGRVETVYDVLVSTMNGPALRAIEKELAPKLSAFNDEIVQNEALFRRIEAVYGARESSGLDAEQKRLVFRKYTSFVRAGAKLDAASKKRLSEKNQRLATLFTTFAQNVLADEEGYPLVLEDEKDLAGLPPSLRASAAGAAEAKGQKGKWLFANTRSAVEPFLTYSSRPDLRKKVFLAYVNRGDNGDAHDNNATISEILALRAERAKLLGYATHAHWRLEPAMANTPERAMQLMESVWGPAVARVKVEVADMTALKVAETKDKKAKIEPWDYRYYAEKVRKAKYDLDESEVKSYFQLEKLREAMFWVAGELYGFAFQPVVGIPVYHPDVRVWEVKDKASGRHVGLWYFDPYAREGKRSGAWMNAYRVQERFRGQVTTIVSNNANFVKGKEGAPVLVGSSDARTLFHEFGHAIHGLSSDVAYPSLAGTRVARDYVEFPSQLNEHWLGTKEVLERFALHVDTGAPMPRALAEKIEKAATFNQGFSTVEYLATALVDMKLHLAGDRKIDPDAFERETLAALRMPPEIVMRHRTPHLSHVFASDGYSAGYYSYLWSDALTADAFGAFREGKGPYDPDVAARLRKNVLSVGDTVDPAEGFRAFRGRDVDTSALMEKRGFVSKAKGR